MKNEYTSTEYIKESIEKALHKAGAAYPFLRAPIEAINFIKDQGIQGFGTDGLDIYIKDKVPSEEDCFHMLIHCIFRHMIYPEHAVKKLWDLACDISAEYLRKELFPGSDDVSENSAGISWLPDALPEDIDPLSAKSIYRGLMDLFEDDIEPLFGAFERDDHRYWYEPSKARSKEDSSFEKSDEKASDAVKKADPFSHVYKLSDDLPYSMWLDEILTERWYAGDDIAVSISKTNRFGLAPGSREERAVLRKEAKYDFSKYLRRFSSTWEEMRADLDSYDYIPYYYGLKRYGNMPLIEPLEYSESTKIEDLVIAIDTSGSCSKAVVERFLSEIESILMQSEFFFKKMNVHIMQCDSIVQSHAAIHSYEEWKDYCQGLTIKGRGGTDFTPVFELTERLIRKGELKKLKGLLYFTDGDGIYPEKPTPYETAFVFTSKSALAYPYPDWITPLCLDMEGPKVSNAVAAFFGTNVIERRKIKNK